MTTAEPDFLDQTIAAWQPLSSDQLTREDARQLIVNTVGFYGTFIPWAQDARGVPQVSDREGHDAQPA